MAWAFRWTVFGAINAWDIITFKHKRFDPQEKEAHAFSLKKHDEAPSRSYGKLYRNEADDLFFVYRPWLIFWPKTTQVKDGTFIIEKGIISPTLEKSDPVNDESSPVFRFPPRYKGHEDELIQTLNCESIKEEPILSGIKKAFLWIKRTFEFNT